MTARLPSDCHAWRGEVAEELGDDAKLLRQTAMRGAPIA
jgi:hypothetical protein